MLSAIVGVLVRLAFRGAGHLVWLSSALGMSLALAVMQVTRTVHPPGEVGVDVCNTFFARKLIAH